MKNLAIDLWCEDSRWLVSILDGHRNAERWGHLLIDPDAPHDPDLTPQQRVEQILGTPGLQWHEQPHVDNDVTAFFSAAALVEVEVDLNDLPIGSLDTQDDRPHRKKRCRQDAALGPAMQPPPIPAPNPRLDHHQPSAAPAPRSVVAAPVGRPLKELIAMGFKVFTPSTSGRSIPAGQAAVNASGKLTLNATDAIEAQLNGQAILLTDPEENRLALSNHADDDETTPTVKLSRPKSGRSVGCGVESAIKSMGLALDQVKGKHPVTHEDGLLIITLNVATALPDAGAE